jgi:hypothetical protein
VFVGVTRSILLTLAITAFTCLVKPEMDPWLELFLELLFGDFACCKEV